jgi:hypothetical protein
MYVAEIQKSIALKKDFVPRKVILKLIPSAEMRGVACVNQIIDRWIYLSP